MREIEVQPTSRLEERVRAKGDIKLIPYLMAGYPDHNRSIEQGLAYAQAGAAAIEVGVPYSGPPAGGPGGPPAWPAGRHSPMAPRFAAHWRSLGPSRKVAHPWS